MEQFKYTTIQKEQTGAATPETEGENDEPKEVIDPRWKDAEEMVAVLGISEFENLRKNHAREEKLWADSRDNVKGAMESERARLEKVRERIQELTQEMDWKRSSIMSRLFNWNRVRILRKELGTQFSVAKALDESAQDKERLVSYFDELLSKEKEYGAYLDQLEQETKDRELREFLEDEEQRKAESLIEKHNVYMVHHLIVNEYKPSANNQAVDTRGLSYEDQLDIAIGLTPSLSVSTLHPNTKEGLFGDTEVKVGDDYVRIGGYGVLLSGGRVRAGSPSDGGSVAFGREERVFPVRGDKGKKLHDIDNAILKVFHDEGPTYATNTSYNELIVQNPKVAGFTFEWLEGDGNMQTLKEGQENVLLDGNGTRYGRWWSSMANIQKRDLPMFVLDRTNNTVREVYDLDFEKRTFKVGPVVEPAELTRLHESQKRHQTPEARKRAVGRVFDHVSGILTDEERKEFDPSLKFEKVELERVLQSEPFEPVALVGLMEREYPNLFERGVGVKEGYSLREHTLMVMSQFETYFSERELPEGFDRDMFRLMLSIHDIGKPEAVSVGNKELQHEYTEKYIDELFGKLGIKESQQKVVQALLKKDTLGLFFKEKISTDGAGKEIEMLAKEADMAPREFLDMLSVLYRVDAGSYTEDAGGKKSLDNLFVFDRENRRIHFAPYLERRFAELQNSLSKNEEMRNPDGDVPPPLPEEEKWHPHMGVPPPLPKEEEWDLSGSAPPPLT